MPKTGSFGSQKGSFRTTSPDARIDTLAKNELRLGAMARGSSHSLTGSLTDASAEENAAGGAEFKSSGSSDDTDAPGEPFDEEAYCKWRTEVKAEYLAWVNAKLEAKRRRRVSLKKDAGKKPRWLLLYEASKRPEPNDATK